MGAQSERILTLVVIGIQLASIHGHSVVDADDRIVGHGQEPVIIRIRVEVGAAAAVEYANMYLFP